MNQQSRPPVWQLVRDAAFELGAGGAPIRYADIRAHVLARFPEVNLSTLNCQITICTVNQPSRINYPENQRARIANAQYDFMYRVDRGTVVLYESGKHGIWSIVPSGSRFRVQQESEASEEVEVAEEVQAGTFALESHLRDYLARNLPVLDEGATRLELYRSEDGREGVEFQTDVGPIDILARCAKSGDLYVFELKLGRGADAALGQIQRYMGWAQLSLARGKRVHGVIVASEISEKLRYAAAVATSVRLMEYELALTLKPCRPKVD